MKKKLLKNFMVAGFLFAFLFYFAVNAFMMSEDDEIDLNNESPASSSELEFQVESETFNSEAVNEDDEIDLNDESPASSSELEFQVESETFNSEAVNEDDEISEEESLPSNENSDNSLIEGIVAENLTNNENFDTNADEMVRLFPDAIFRKFVSSKIDATGNVLEQIALIKELEIIGKVVLYDDTEQINEFFGIENLEGIEHFTNLEVLTIEHTKLKALDISKLKKVKSVSCKNNFVEKLILKGANDLTEINCAYNKISEIDADDLENLELLQCRNNKIEKLSFKGCSKIKSLMVLNNRLKMLDIKDFGIKSIYTTKGGQKPLIEIFVDDVAATNIDFASIVGEENIGRVKMDAQNDYDYDKETGILTFKEKCTKNEIKIDYVYETGGGSNADKMDVTLSVFFEFIKPVERVHSPEDYEMFVGDTKQIDYEITPSNATNKNVFLQSLASNIVTVNDMGLAKAISEGVAEIEIKSEDGDHVAKCTVTVHGIVEDLKPVMKKVDGILFSNQSIELVQGQDVVLIAQVQPADAADISVTWESTRANIASVDANGKVFAVSKGVASIIATTTDGGHTAKCDITVSELPIEPDIEPDTEGEATPQKVVLSKTEITLAPKKGFQLKATVLPKGISQSVIWKSSKPKVVSVNLKGYIKAEKNVKKGKATIYATSISGEKIGKCVVTIGKPVKSVKLKKPAKYVKKGSFMKLQAILNPTKPTNRKLVWTSSNKKVVTVNGAGRVRGIKKGKAVITVTTRDGGKKAKITVYVR